MKSIKSKTILAQKFRNEKCIAAFDYIKNALIVSSATSGCVSIISVAFLIGALAGKASASFTIEFFLTTGIIKKLQSIATNKKKNNYEILVFAKSKLNSIETLISQALTDIEISHEEFITTLNEKNKYGKMKENLRNINEKSEEKTENIRLNGVNSRT